MKYNLKCIDFTATYYQNGAIAPKEKSLAYCFNSTNIICITACQVGSKIYFL